LVNGFKIVSDLPAVQQVSLSHSATISLPFPNTHLMPAAATRNQHH